MRSVKFCAATAVRANNAQKSNHSKNNQQHKTRGLVTIIAFLYNNNDYLK